MSAVNLSHPQAAIPSWRRKPVTDTTYDPAENARLCYDLAVRAAREKCIRRGQIKPDASKPGELRWAKEGERDPSELEAARNG